MIVTHLEPVGGAEVATRVPVEVMQVKHRPHVPASTLRRGCEHWLQ